MPQTKDMAPHPVLLYRHGADLSLCYPFTWNVTLEYTATHFNVLGETRPGNPSPTFHTHQRTLNLMLLKWSTVGSSVESTVPNGSWTRDLWCANPLRYPLAHSDFWAFNVYHLSTILNNFLGLLNFLFYFIYSFVLFIFYVFFCYSLNYSIIIFDYISIQGGCQASDIHIVLVAVSWSYHIYFP